MDYRNLMKEYPQYFSNERAPFKIIEDEKIITKWVNEQREELKKCGKSPEMAKIGIVMEDNVIVMIRDLVKFPNEKLGGYIRLFNKDEFSGGKGVVILPIYEDKIVLIKHFRHATRLWHWEIPRGFGVSGVLPVEQAEVEIKEEIGGKIKTIEELGKIYINTGMEGNQTVLFVARLSSIGTPEENEGISEYRIVSVNEMDRMIYDGSINDGFTISTYSKAKIAGVFD